MSKDFGKLKVWKKSHQLTLAAYKATIPFPKEEIYGLTSQIRRSSSSIAANIAEGCCRSGNIEFSRFLQIAMGSASELEYHWILAHDLGYLADPDYDQLTEKTIEVKQMLSSFIQKLKAEG
jgi:four helix bundle protein